MKKGIYLLLIILCFKSYANQTTRQALLTNDKVKVWQTTIFPAKDNTLAMHRHDNSRVVIALDSGTLKITNNKGAISYLKLEKNKAYFLDKNSPNELHQDENIGKTPIRVYVIEFKQ